MSSRITRPGKFEGEPSYAPHFWNVVLNGYSDLVLRYEDDTPISVVVLTDEDRARFDIEPDRYALLLTEDANGFVWTSEITEEAYDELVEEMEAGSVA